MRMPRSEALAFCAWCLPAVALEVYLYAAYRGHEARFHWFTHFFAGTAAALLILAAVAARTRRPVPYPLLWLILGHLVAMFPDLLFNAGIAHERWMDVFLGHISTHYLPGGNVTWFAVFLTCLALYLSVLDRRTVAQP